mmetsp:Transcript_35826/g.65712  ORF Transcript_35826/g.65712 Transcript_35826/m.65712 type:complete len:227 (+) Transcript_35826:1618-2298(+)
MRLDMISSYSSSSARSSSSGRMKFSTNSVVEFVTEAASLLAVPSVLRRFTLGSFPVNPCPSDATPAPTSSSTIPFCSFHTRNRSFNTFFFKVVNFFLRGAKRCRPFLVTPPLEPVGNSPPPIPRWWWLPGAEEEGALRFMPTMLAIPGWDELGLLLVVLPFFKVDFCKACFFLEPLPLAAPLDVGGGRKEARFFEVAFFLEDPAPLPFAGVTTALAVGGCFWPCCG